MDVFVDTNALTLLLLGATNINYIESHPKLSVYTKEDYLLLQSYVCSPHRIVTTPNIWTETDNHCNGLNGSDRYSYLGLFRKIVSDSLEKFVTTNDAVKSDYFLPVGLADCITLDAAQECDLLITGDSQLADYARGLSIEVVDLKLVANIRLA